MPNPSFEIYDTCPDNTELDAKLFFYDKNGNVLRTVKIEQRGTGELTVYASNFSSGTYSYSLFVNEKVIDTKRVVKAK